MTDIETNALPRSCHEALILAVVAEGPHHGYQLALEIEERSSGFFRFKHGTLYPILHKLEADGMVESEWRQSGTERRRRQYSLTTAGGERLSALRRSLEAFFETLLTITGRAEQ